MTVYITLTTAGSDSGPFNLYSNLDGYVTPFEAGVAKSVLTTGHSCSLVPDYTSTIRIESTSTLCANHIDIPVSTTTTTTTT